MTQKIFLLIMLLVTLQNCSTPKKESKNIQKDTTKNTSIKPIELSDSILLEKIRGKVFSSGDCFGLTYSEYSFDIIFSEDSTVKVHNWDSMNTMHLLYGTYQVKDKQLIIQLQEESSMHGQHKRANTKKAVLIPKHKVDKKEMYEFDFITCENKTRLKKLNLDYELGYSEPLPPYKTRVIRGIEEHEIEFEDNNLSLNIGQLYISQEKGVEEKIYVAKDTDFYIVKYKSPKYETYIYLNVENSNFQENTCEVIFPVLPNLKYKMQFTDSEVICIYPDGKVQKFRRKN